MLRYCAMLSWVFVMLSNSQAAADLVSPYGGETAPSFAELSVEQDHVRVVLEIDLNEYPVFVAPETAAVASLADRTGLTFEVAADGIPLDRVTKVIDVRPRIARRAASTAIVPARPRSEEVVFVEIAFPFLGRPETLTFIPPLDNDGRPKASIGMLATHLGVPVTDYRYLSQAETMRPDWTDPWFTTFENPNLTRHHKSPLMSFLSMEAREVRHEIIFRLRDLQTWSDLALGGQGNLTQAQLADVRAAATEFFAARNPLTIDGEAARPQNVRIYRISVGAEGLNLIDDTVPVNRETELFGAVLSYPRPELADSVEMTWELFPDGIEVIPVTISDPAGGVPAQAYRTDPSVVWQNHLTRWQEPQTGPVHVSTASTVTLPLVAGLFALGAAVAGIRALRTTSTRRIALAGASGLCIAGALTSLTIPQTIELPFSSRPSEAQVHAVLDGVFTGIGAAMLEPGDETFEAALEPFVADLNRGNVSAEIRRGLSVTLPSGARARTDAVRDIGIEAISRMPESGATQILASWTADLSGGHWGHIHSRQVTYRGLIDLSQDGDRWFLDGLTVLKAQTKG